MSDSSRIVFLDDVAESRQIFLYLIPEKLSMKKNSDADKSCNSENDASCACPGEREFVITNGSAVHWYEAVASLATFVKVMSVS